MAVTGIGGAATSLGVAPDQVFPPTVIQTLGACTSSLKFPISNTGSCNLTITDISISGANAADYSISGLPSFPIILQPGHVAGDGDLSLVFGPKALARSRTATVTVTYVNDPSTGGTTSVNRALCGEGVNTGVRLLVTKAGVPVPSVDKILIKRVKKRPSKGSPVTVNETTKNVLLQTVAAPTSCVPLQFHREWGGASNPVQLLPGDYQLQVTFGKKTSKVVAFSLTTCDFNKNIVINF